MNFITRIQSVPFNQKFAIILLVVMSTLLVVIEGLTVSPLKVTVMVVSCFIFLFRVPYFSKAVWGSVVYWGVCFLTALLNGEVRFSTLGYLGLFLIAYIVFYNLIYIGTFTLVQFKSLLKSLLIAYCIVLLCQQLCILVGIRNVPILNLVGFDYYAWDKLPTLSCEPSHTARIISASMLGYIQCLEIETQARISFRKLFDKENRIVTFSYLWLVLTMGSGTGWIGFVILCLYFIRLKSFLYIIPLFAGLFLILQYSGNKQFLRASSVFKATISGDVTSIYEADGSGAIRVVPLVNTLTDIDLTDADSWIGKGTYLEKSTDVSESKWTDLTRKIAIVEQYGLLGLLSSIFFFYLCVVRRFFSLETVYFVVLLLCSLGNEYFTWSMLFVFTAMRYFKDQEVKWTYQSLS